MSGKKRIRMKINGVVQGVGFRPFLHRAARKYGVAGWVRNTQAGVELEVEGEPEALGSFQREIVSAPPPLAVLEKVETNPMEGLTGSRGFQILPSSTEGEDGTFLSPDIAPCSDCLRELADPSDRRYRYPFLNCTNCGPRYTIIRALPYDRRNTTMRDFTMCGDCSREYGDLSSRRYHAQPDCCPNCGPQAFYLDETGKQVKGDPVALAQDALAKGEIVAVKGAGGIHLACDARNEEAVRRLRRRKRREGKPLAAMCRGMDQAKGLCNVSEEEAALLQSPRRPIVLLRKKEPKSFSWLSANQRIGIMLPYTPLHVLLLDGTSGGPDCVVMTSANLAGCPVMIGNEEAVEGLQGIADGYLLHNRPIQNRCDDSLVMEWQGKPYFFRRSRGYAPQPVSLAGEASGIVAFGAEQKASFAVGRGKYAFPSPHIGDLKNLETLEHYQESLEDYCRLFRVAPLLLACDLHPDYASTRQAEELAQREGLPLLRVQHHWAHMASCMADNSLDQDAFGIVWDGTGLGTDGQIWGGEFFVGGYDSFRQVGSIRPILLAGGDAAAKEPGRVAAALLLDAGLPPEDAPLEKTKRPVIAAMLQKKVGCIPASSVGRLFDGVYALFSRCGTSTYEGQGASLLEAAACPETKGRDYPVCFYSEEGVRRFDFRPMVCAIAADCRDKIPPAAIAKGFMDALCRMALEQCAVLNREKRPVVLSGGVFQNYYLLSNLTRLLREQGYLVYTHKRVSANDEGICLGQLAIAQRSRMNHVSGCSAENHGNQR